MTGLEEVREYIGTIEDEAERSRRLDALYRRERAARVALNDQDVSGGPVLLDMADTILQGVREAWEDYERQYDAVEDRLGEIADGAVPIYTYARAAAMAEDNGLCCTVPDVEPRERTVSAVAAAVRSDLAYQVASAELDRIAEGDTDED